MEFVGSDAGGCSSIPVPNMELAPEMLCKNYPLEFLLQPIIPLLSPPVSDEPSFSFSLPGIQSLFDVFTSALENPTVQMVGAGIAFSGIAYFSWKLSKKWNEGALDNKITVIDPDTTEHLDDEVARIMSTMKPEDNTVTSACSSMVCHSFSKGEFTSNTSFFLERMSQDSLCFCGEGGGPLKQLQSQIDQVMSRMEDVISGLKAFEVAKRDSSSSTSAPLEDADCKKNSIIEVSLDDGHIARQQAQVMRQLRLADDGRDIDKRTDDFQDGIRKLEAASDKIGKAIECGSNQSSIPKMNKLGGVSTFGNGLSTESSYEPSPRNLCFTDTVSMLDKMVSPSETTRPSPLRNTKRNIHSRNYNLRPFPTIEEHPSCCCTESELNESPKSDFTNFPLGKGQTVEDNEFHADSGSKSREMAYRFVMARESISGDVETKKDWEKDSTDSFDFKFELKRHETWPLQSNKQPSEQKDDSADRSSFTHSENSDFQVLEPFCSSLSAESFKFKPTKDAVDDNTTPILSGTSQNIKPHNSPRNNKQPNLPIRSSLYSFKNKSSPGKPAARPLLDRVPEEPESTSNEELVTVGNTTRLVNIHRSKVFSNTFNGHAIDSENPFSILTTENPQKSAVSQNETDDKSDDINSKSPLKQTKHKLDPENVDEAEAPPKKLACPAILKTQESAVERETRTDKLDDGQASIVSNDLDSESDSAADSKRVHSSTSMNRSSMRFITSPFKRNSKTKISDFQVKFVASKNAKASENVKISHSNTVTNNNNVGQADDEWIVISTSEQ